MNKPKSNKIKKIYNALIKREFSWLDLMIVVVLVMNWQSDLVMFTYGMYLLVFRHFINNNYEQLK